MRAGRALGEIAACLDGGACGARSVVQEHRPDGDCRNEIHLWSRAADGRSAAIRDLKMCDSERKRRQHADFAHGLHIPLQPVSGVEDPQLYGDAVPLRALWQDAWSAAGAMMGEANLALVINPPSLRSQGHLHIHLVRRNGIALPPEPVTPLDDLGDVWNLARGAARKMNIADSNYGILIARQEGRFQMLVQPGCPPAMTNSEYGYTIAED